MGLLVTGDLGVPVAMVVMVVEEPGQVTLDSLIRLAGQVAHLVVMEVVERGGAQEEVLEPLVRTVAVAVAGLEHLPVVLRLADLEGPWAQGAAAAAVATATRVMEPLEATQVTQAAVDLRLHIHAYLLQVDPLILYL